MCITCALPMWTISLLKDSTEFPARVSWTLCGEPGLVCPCDPDRFLWQDNSQRNHLVDVILSSSINLTFEGGDVGTLTPVSRNSSWFTVSGFLLID